MCQSETKTCTQCGETKPATPEYFYRKSQKSDGLRPVCKPCQDAYKASRKTPHRKIKHHIEAQALACNNGFILKGYHGKGNNVHTKYDFHCLKCNHKQVGVELRGVTGRLRECPACQMRERWKLLDGARREHGLNIEFTTPILGKRVGCRCLNDGCGREWTAFTGDIRKGIGCSGCADYGFTPSNPAILYVVLVRQKTTGIVSPKVGITNLTVSDRYTPSVRKRYDLITTLWQSPRMDGRVVEKSERIIIAEMQRRGWVANGTREQLREGSPLESWAAVIRSTKAGESLPLDVFPNNALPVLEYWGGVATYSAQTFFAWEF